MTNIFRGERVRLRAVEPSDWVFFHAMNESDTEIARAVDEIWFPSSSEATRLWTDEQSRSRAVQDVFRFQIEALDTGNLVGTLNTHSTNPRIGTFMYGIVIAPQFQRKGYASEAITLLLRYFFDEKRYQKCTVEIFSFNQPSIHLHKRLGFTLEGRLRRMVYTGGQYHDALMYGLLREEFEGHPSV